MVNDEADTLSKIDPKKYQNDLQKLIKGYCIINVIK